METFSLQAHLQHIYGNYPEADRKPVIGITANFRDGQACLCDLYYRQVAEAGGVPLMIPPVADGTVISNTLDRIDGLLLSGGGDINPLWMDEQPSPNLHDINHQRDLPELLTARLAYNRQIPMLAICRGIQTLAAALGGTIIQDLPEEWEARRQKGDHPIPLVKHSQDSDNSTPTHTVTLQPDSILSRIYDHAQRLCVNSLHHQAVGNTGTLFRPVATAPDGVIEAMESTEEKAILGVQWHPEWLGESGLKLFRWLVDEAETFRKAKNIHRHTLTLDTHCDTPMLFSAGADFTKRDDRILVDLHKMADGRLDAVTMVAYLPQPKPGQAFSDCVPFAVQSPSAYANLIFDKIEHLVSTASDHVSLASSPQQLLQNKRNGRKSIVLGIENGLALDGDIRQVAHFARRGVTYITLCHNGDNEICDSAKGSQTHGGVSVFGAKVIEEMNRCGLMVDLSHGAEKSFYDALDISRTPIVCSHSSCKALCDHPRNLTDDQMRALKAKGGVVQITLYPGFLRNGGKTSITDAIAHLEHAIRTMGVDHVGLGTDFDGDGGITGLANASEMIQFTRQLLLKRYNQEDIQKIWGGNWLRVMTQVQTARQTHDYEQKNI